MNKLLIQQRFSKSLETYDENAVVQREMAEKLAEFADIKKADNILELGCGTGLLTREIIKKTEFKKYIALDIVKECEKFINNISPEIKFIAEDIENIKTDTKFNLIISNASLQWLEDFPSFVKKLVSMLDKDGILLFTIFGKKNYIEMNNFIKTPLRYISPQELEEIFSNLGRVQIEETEKILEFEKPSDILHHMKNTGVNSLDKVFWTKSDLKNFDKNYPKNENGKYPLTYNPIYIKLGV